MTAPINASESAEAFNWVTAGSSARNIVSPTVASATAAPPQAAPTVWTTTGNTRDSPMIGMLHVTESTGSQCNPGGRAIP